MSTDELWALHEEIASRLAATLLAEKRILENRLKQLKGGVEAERESSPTGRRPYPTVVPKFGIRIGRPRRGRDEERRRAGLLQN
jgi:DNA-binding protein H-NS